MNNFDMNLIDTETVQIDIPSINQMELFEVVRAKSTANLILKKLKERGVILDGSKFEIINNTCEILLVCIDKILPNKLIETKGKILDLPTKWNYTKVDIDKVSINYTF